MNNVLVTGGAGFIGCNFIRYLFEETEFSGRIINLDALTYAGNPLSLADLEADYGERYVFVRGDICDRDLIDRLLREHEVDVLVNFAAESHVDRSIVGPGAFIQTNIVGTFTLLDAARHYFADQPGFIFHHVSTDEVYGSLGDTGEFHETTAYDPHSPYAASKASSDHLVMAYHDTYGLPVKLSNCSNNYGPYQFPEKLIPLMIHNILTGKPLPVYGDGKNVRDWLYVTDHAEAIHAIIAKGALGETYNVGGRSEQRNIDIVNILCETVARKTDKDPAKVKELITFVKDRPGHDWRYAINCDKIERDLGWTPRVDFAEGIEKTVDWYLANQEWVERITSGEYQKWIEQNYGDRKG